MKWDVKVKELRMKLLLSQSEFADLLGVAYSTVSRWEKGHYEPTIKQKRELAKLFKENGMLIE